MAGWGGPWSSLLRRLTLPQTAGPNDPRIVVGSDLPPELTAPSPNGYGSNIKAAIIYYLDADHYGYDAVVNGRRVWGFVNRTYPEHSRIAEAFRYRYPDGPSGTRAEFLFTSAIGAATDYYFDFGKVTFEDTANFNYIAKFFLQLDVYGSFKIDDRSQPRGLMSRVTSNAASASTVSTAGVSVLTIPAATYKVGRVYEVRMRGGIQPGAVNGGAFFDVRNMADLSRVGEYYRYSCPTVTVWNAEGDNVRFTVQTADKTRTLALFMATINAAISITHYANAGQPRYAEVWDIGDVDDYETAGVPNVHILN